MKTDTIMNLIRTLSLCAFTATVTVGPMEKAAAQASVNATSPSLAAKLLVRGEAPETTVFEIRIIRKGDILSVQSDVRNAGKKDQGVFYRYRWLDQAGNQFGSGDAWKQLNLLGMSQNTIKGSAPHPSVSDFRLELSFDTP